MTETEAANLNEGDKVKFIGIKNSRYDFLFTTGSLVVDKLYTVQRTAYIDYWLVLDEDPIRAWPHEAFELYKKEEPIKKKSKKGNWGF